jgi:DNA replication protein DnaC
MNEANKAGDLSHMNFEELPEKRFECPVHGSYNGKPIRFSSPWVIKGCPHIVNPECPICAKEEKARKAEETACNKRQEEMSQFEAMNIGKKFWESTFENFDAYNGELKHNLKVAKQFAKKPKGKLVMIGENGNGKNHLAAVIVKETGGVIYTCSEIGVMLRDCYNGRNSEAELFYRLCNIPLLAIDELDKVKESEAKNNWMSHIIGKRYNNMLPIILIANGHLRQDCTNPQKPCAKCLEYHLENDVISRIFEDGILLKFTSEDYRYRIRANKGEPI